MQSSNTSNIQASCPEPLIVIVKSPTQTSLQVESQQNHPSAELLAKIDEDYIARLRKMIEFVKNYGGSARITDEQAASYQKFKDGWKRIPGYKRAMNTGFASIYGNPTYAIPKYDPGSTLEIEPESDMVKCGVYDPNLDPGFILCQIHDETTIGTGGCPEGSPEPQPALANLGTNGTGTDVSGPDEVDAHYTVGPGCD